MKNKSFIRALRRRGGLLVAGAMALSAVPAHAQIWVWRDENNHTISSDQPPPPGVPLKNIVRTPRPAPARPVPEPPKPDAAVAGTPALEKKVEAPKTTAEKDLEFKKRRKEAADAEKKQEEESAKAKALADRCKALRGNLAGLESGVRIARIKENGERKYLDDAQRQGEIDKTRTASAGCN